MLLVKCGLRGIAVLGNKQGYIQLIYDLKLSRKLSLTIIIIIAVCIMILR